MRCRLQLCETITESAARSSQCLPECVQNTCAQPAAFTAYHGLSSTCFSVALAIMAAAVVAAIYLRIQRNGQQHIGPYREENAREQGPLFGPLQVGCVYMCVQASSPGPPPARVTLQQHCTLYPFRFVPSIRAPYTHLHELARPRSFSSFRDSFRALLSFAHHLGVPSFISSVRAMCAFFFLSFVFISLHRTQARTHVQKRHPYAMLLYLNPAPI